MKEEKISKNTKGTFVQQGCRHCGLSLKLDNFQKYDSWNPLAHAVKKDVIK